MAQTARGDLGARYHDMERRLRPRRRAMFAVLAAALLASGPWIGWWQLLPLTIAMVAPALLQARLRRSDRPERWDAAVWLVGPVMIAVTVVLTGGPHSPGLIWFVLPAVTLQIRGTGHRPELGLAGLLLLVLASTLGSDPAAFAADPSPVIFTTALLVATAFLTGAVTEAEHEFRHAAAVDPLTGLPNRLALAADLDALATRPPPGGMAMLAGDLVAFKDINDSFGHTAGDTILRSVAGALHRSLRAQDRIYRIGGDEFLVLLPGTSEDEARAIARRLTTAVTTASAGETAVAIRFGVAATQGADFSFERLYAGADRALIAAKQDAPGRSPEVTVVARVSTPAV